MTGPEIQDHHGHTWYLRAFNGRELLLRKVAGQPALYGIYSRDGRRTYTLTVLSRRRVEAEHTFMSRGACFDTAARTDAARRGASARTGTRTGNTSTFWTYTTA